MWNAQQTVNSKSMLMFSFHGVGQDSLRLKWDYLEGLSTGYASTTPGLPPRSSVPQTESFSFSKFQESSLLTCVSQAFPCTSYYGQNLEYTDWLGLGHLITPGTR